MRTITRYAGGLIAIMSIALLTDLSYAQPPEGGGRGGRGGGIGGPGGEGGPGGGRQGGRGGAPGGFGGGREGGRGGFGGGPEQMMKMFPLMVALDTNKDGVISSEEIDGAVIALKKLDKDKNGKLEGPELMPDIAAMMRGRGGAGGPGGFGGGEGRPRRPGEDGPGAGQSGRPSAGGGQNVTAFLERMFGPDGIDENKDNKLSQDEVPDRMKEMFASADADKDGFMSRAEVETFLKARAVRVGGRGRGGDAGGRGRGGEGGAGRGRGGEGGAGGNAEGNRPRRPQRPAVEEAEDDK